MTTETCAGCFWASRKWQYLGWKPYCRYYRAIRDIKCIDWKPKCGTIIDKEKQGILRGNECES